MAVKLNEQLNELRKEQWRLQADVKELKINFWCWTIGVIILILLTNYLR